eukprot:1157270-Pelagomonas_calceolata.AAC.4
MECALNICLGCPLRSIRFEVHAHETLCRSQCANASQAGGNKAFVKTTFGIPMSTCSRFQTFVKARNGGTVDFRGMQREAVRTLPTSNQGKGDTLVQRTVNLPHQRIIGKLVWVWWVPGRMRPKGTRRTLSASKIPMQDFLEVFRHRQQKVWREADALSPKEMNRKAVTYHHWCGKLLNQTAHTPIQASKLFVPLYSFQDLDKEVMKNE